MGALHEGHVSLVRLSRKACGLTVVSIFVNPLQFSPGEDFERYPRREAEDAALLASAGAELLYIPAAKDFYPPDFATAIEVAGVSGGGEGDARPGHFRGVATAVAKLFLQVQPDAAFFGRKDLQQVAVIRRMARDLDFPIRIEAGPTIREPDGLALSSRNAYLSPDERRAATVLFRSLRAGIERAMAGERDASGVRAAVVETVAAEPLAELDYAEVVRADDLQPFDRLEDRVPVLLALAVRIGRTRLIDNIPVDAS